MRKKVNQKQELKNTKPVKHTSSPMSSSFHWEFKNQSQKLAWSLYQQHQILFLTGPAGSAKTFISTAFAITEVINKTKKKIVLTRPIVEAGEKLGFLPGDLNEKVDPYMMPLYDSINKLVKGSQREYIEQSLNVVPIAFMRGLTFTDSVCIFDEAQNATYKQLVLFLTRLGENSKMIITGDTEQTDLKELSVALTDIIEDVQTIRGIGVMQFQDSDIVRSPLVSEILKKTRKRMV